MTLGLFEADTKPPWVQYPIERKWLSTLAWFWHHQFLKTIKIDCSKFDPECPLEGDYQSSNAYLP